MATIFYTGCCQDLLNQSTLSEIKCAMIQAIKLDAQIFRQACLLRQDASTRFQFVHKGIQFGGQRTRGG
jgi:hypothetical protein